MTAFRRSLPLVLTSFIVFLAIAPEGRSQGRGDEPWKPTPPFVASPAEFSAWRITIEENKKNDDAEPAVGMPSDVVSIDSTRTKNIKLDRIRYRNGNTSEVWFVKRTVIVVSPSGDISIDGSGGAAANYTVNKFASPGFPFTEWITDASFNELKALKDGRLAAFYSGDFEVIPESTGLDSSAPPIYVPDAETGKIRLEQPKAPKKAKEYRSALIAKDSKLPISVTLGSTKLVFTFKRAPSKILSVPRFARQELERMAKNQRGVDKLRSVQRGR